MILNQQSEIKNQKLLVDSPKFSINYFNNQTSKTIILESGEISWGKPYVLLKFCKLESGKGGQIKTL